MLRELRHAVHGSFSLAFSPDNHFLAAAGRQRLYLFDVSSGRMLAEKTDDDLSYASVCFSPDGKNLILAGTDGLALVLSVSKLCEIYSCSE